MTRRTERINDLLREEISDLVRLDVKDPRVGGLISVTEVDITPDLRHAKVFVSVLGSDEQRRNTMEALRAASNFLQRELRKRITIRRIPELTFLPDDSLARGARILSLIDEAQEGGQPGT